MLPGPISFIQTHKRSIVRGAGVIIILLVAIVSLAVVWNYFVTKKSVTLSPSSGTTITISSHDKAQKHPITTSAQKTVRLAGGKYDVTYSAGPDYQDETESIEINKALIIKTPDLAYSESRLTQLLAQQKATIHKALQPYLPNPGYQIEIERLLHTGEWYGARIIPKDWYDPNSPSNYLVRQTNDSNTQDMYKIIMKLENGQWKVVAKPSVVLFTGDYPDIPQDIIRTVNKMGSYDRKMLAAEFNKVYPIIKSLPIYNDSYIIDYQIPAAATTTKSSTPLILNIRVLGINRLSPPDPTYIQQIHRAALDNLTNRGFKLSDFQIVFDDSPSD